MLGNIMEKYERDIKPLFKTNEKVTAKQIKSACGFNGSNVYSYVNELVDKGYLIKEADLKDGRKSYYKLPDANSDRKPAVAEPDEKRAHGRAYAEPEKETAEPELPELRPPTTRRLKRQITDYMQQCIECDQPIAPPLKLLYEIEKAEAEIE